MEQSFVEETVKDKSIYETLNWIQKLYQSRSPLYHFCRTILHKTSYILAMILMKNSFMTRIEGENTRFFPNEARFIMQARAQVLRSFLSDVYVT